MKIALVITSMLAASLLVAGCAATTGVAPQADAGAGANAKTDVIAPALKAETNAPVREIALVRAGAPVAASEPVIDLGAPVSPAEKRARQAQFAEAMADVEERQRVFKNAAASQVPLTIDGVAAQGGLLFGTTTPGADVRLDGAPVMVGEDGGFVIGFGRDSALTALLTVKVPGAEPLRKTIEIEDRTFKVERIDGLDQSKVSGFTEAQLEKIRAGTAKKKAARAVTDSGTLWRSGFDWPVTGRISGVFGSQRILNGEPKRPHSGVDVARPTGTPIRAPADGVVRLADSDMYFEGGLVLLDHGQWLESAFLHMSRIDVAPGQRVKKGDIIGAVGATGRVTGPHLHWSVKWTGRLVDPQLLVGEMPAAGGSGQ